MNKKQRAVIQEWLKDCQQCRIKIGERELIMEECDMLAQAIRALAGDLEMAGKKKGRRAADTGAGRGEAGFSGP